MRLPLTKTPCPRCLNLAKENRLRVEAVQRLPHGAFAPRAKVPGGEKCCLDCASADTLLQVGLAPSWEAARIVVANDRQEQYRLPGIQLGMVQAGLVRPSEVGDLEDQHLWLNSMEWFHIWHGEPCQEHADCKTSPELGRACRAVSG